MADPCGLVGLKIGLSYGFDRAELDLTACGPAHRHHPAGQKKERPALVIVNLASRRGGLMRSKSCSGPLMARP